MTGTAAAHPHYTPHIPGDLPAGERPMVAVVRAATGHEEPLAAAITTLTAAVRREPGCLEFRAFRAATDPGVFYLFEAYADTAAFRTHLTTAHVAHFFTELAQHSTSDARSLVQLVELLPGGQFTPAQADTVESGR